MSAREDESQVYSQRLTPESRFRLDYLGAPAALSEYVTTFYHFRCDDAEIRDIQPAAIGHLSLFPYGVGRMSLPGGGFDHSHEVNLLTPFAKAANFEVSGPFHAIGAALTPLGWAALTGLCAKEHANHLYPAREWLGEEVAAMGETLCEDYRQNRKSAAECAEDLGALILDRVQPIKPKHTILIAATNAWLAASLQPELADLYAASPFSERQTQRLVERYFGLSPVALRRKYRALRAATLLSLPTLTPEYDAQIGDAFYDQPHMIREIRLFVGRTPSRLGGGNSPFLDEMLDGRNMRELGSPEPDA